jgi:hypothetical protein
MSTDVSDSDDAPSTAPVPDRYAAVETDDGDLVVFDAEDADAWIQSTNATCLSQLR